jgi:acetyl-CoA carboxylase biotin carboxyl carrier protein
VGTIAPAAIAAPAPAPLPEPVVTIEKKSKQPVEDDNLITVKAQMIGTFYRSPSPDKPPFVEVGTLIKPGDKLCIIEAMKLFNEIESEVSGKIVKVLTDDITPVEFDQPLFLVDPS